MGRCSLRLAVCLATGLSWHPVTAADCLPYEPATVTLAGKLVRQVFPGRPNFGSVAEGDEKRVYWILKLDKPACVGAETCDDLNQPRADIREVQIAPTGDLFYKRNRRALGKKVRVSGTLFHQHTAWHVTPVVLLATTVTYAQAR